MATVIFYVNDDSTIPVKDYLDYLKKYNRKNFYFIVFKLLYISKKHQNFSHFLIHRVSKSIYVLKYKESNIFLGKVNNVFYLLHAYSGKLNKDNIQIAVERYKNI